MSLLWMLLSAYAADLEFEVTGMRSDEGSVVALLFVEGKGFPNDPRGALAKVSAPIQERRATVTFTGLPQGTYAVGFLHDENGNGKADYNLLRAPKEGVTTSRDAMGRFGPPPFEDSAVKVGSGPNQHSVKITYLFD